jgi:hypothetical protein
LRWTRVILFLANVFIYNIITEGLLSDRHTNGMGRRERERERERERCISRVFVC